MERPNWAKTFFDIAIDMSKRSPDKHTKCGCVIVNPDNEIVATGYNGHIRDVAEGGFPLNRPDEPNKDFPGLDKYPFFIHAEHNAILNCARQGKSTKGCISYATMESCNYCIQYLWQAGIKEIHYINQKPNLALNNEYRAIRSILLGKMKGLVLVEHNMRGTALIEYECR